jgi:hypothetical protein
MRRGAAGPSPDAYLLGAGEEAAYAGAETKAYFAEGS